MPHELLTVKLDELDEAIGRLHGRIESSQTDTLERLQDSIVYLSHECVESEHLMHNRLKYSKAEPVRKMLRVYEEIKSMIQNVYQQFESNQSADTKAEEKLLLAEYALDFAMQSANHAVLLSLKAIAADREETEREGIQ